MKHLPFTLFFVVLTNSTSYQGTISSIKQSGLVQLLQKMLHRTILPVAIEENVNLSLTQKGCLKFILPMIIHQVDRMQRLVITYQE